MKTNDVSLECKQQKRNLSRKTQTSVVSESTVSAVPSESTALFWCSPKYTEMNRGVFMCTVTSRSVII